MGERRVLDITQELEGQVIAYPGDAPFRRIETASCGGGDGFNLSRLEMSAHSGTHLDAPAHFLADGRRMGDYPPESFLLQAQVVEVLGPDHVGSEALDVVGEGTEAVLFRTANSRRRLARGGVFVPDFAALTPAAAERCVELGLQLVGIDYFSVDPQDSEEYPVHKILAHAGALVLENADLVDVAPGGYRLLCAPLRMAGAEASPVRALLVEGLGIRD